MSERLADISLFAHAHPLGVVLVFAAIVFLAFLAWAIRTDLFLQAAAKFFYLTRNAIAVDVGWRELVYWLILGLIFGVPAAFIKGWGTAAEPFHWSTFWTVLLVIGLARVGDAAYRSLTESRRLLRPVHGTRWRADRKVATAGILKKVNRLLDSAPITAAEARTILTDVLHVIVLHVRDYRGNHKNVRVFANLLLVDGDDLVVVARDPNLQSDHYKRDIPARHKKAALATGRAVEGRCVVSVGKLTQQYPEAPRNKPYVSILAIPLLSSNDERVIGALCIDSTQPYFFESFVPGAVENELENSLSPYVHTLVLLLEGLLSRDPSEMLGILLEEAPTTSGQPRRLA